MLQPNRVGLEDNEYGDLAVDFYGTSQVIDPRGNFVGERGSGEHEEMLVRDLDMDMVQQMRDDWQFYRDRRPDSYTDREAVGEGAHDHHTHHGRHGRLGHRPRRGRRPHRRRDHRRGAAPGSELLGTDVAASVDTVIDATGKYVIPGGIDAHTHMELPFGGTPRATRSRRAPARRRGAARRSIIDFAVQRYGERVQDGLAAWHEKAAGNCAIDYGFHQIIGGVDEDSLPAMPALIDEGITSFKLFMAYPGVFYSDDAQILQGDAEVGARPACSR